MAAIDTARGTTIRFGVLLDAPAVTVWQAETITRLERTAEAVLVVVVVVGEPRESAGIRRAPRPPYRRAPRRRPLAARAGGAILDWYGRRLSRASSERPSAAVAWAAEIPILRVRQVAGEGSGLVLPAEDVAAIRAHRLDVLLDLGAAVLGGDVLDATRYGVWSFRHGGRAAGDAWPVGFWEIVGRRAVVHAALERRSADGTSLLRQGWFQVARHSYALTRDRVRLGAASWPALVCRAIRDGIDLADTPAPTARDRRDVQVRHVVRLVAITAEARLRRLWHHGMRHDDWNIGVIDAPAASLVGRRTITDVRWAPTRRGRYAADPFGRWDGAALTVLFEDFIHARDRATIARRTWSRNGGWGPPRSALDPGTHLSYPFLVEDGGHQLMLPESRASGRLILYEATDDGGWRPYATLDVSGDVGDSTLLRHDGRWWLFAVAASRLNPATELLLWYADRLEGPWTEHVRNPVVVDVRCARPGGPLFTAGGVLHRPAQDCSTGYGDRLTLRRVTTLTTDRFEEETVCTLGPDPLGPFPHGLHTLTAVGDVTLVDGKRRVWNTRATVLRIRRRLPI